MRGRTTDQLLEAAMSYGLERIDALRIVAELQADGIAEMTEDGLWRLTPWAEEEYGQALRDLSAFVPASSDRATDRLDSEAPQRAGGHRANGPAQTTRRGDLHAVPAG